MGIPWSHFYLGSLILSAFNVAFLVITFQPTTTEFLSDRENALTVINRPAKNQDAYMEVMSPIVKSEPDAGGMNDQRERNNSMRILLFCFFFFSFFSFHWFSSILALRRALSSPYQWAVSIFSLIYCGWSVFYPLLRRKLTDETSQVKLPHRVSWVECTSFCFWLNFSLDGHLSLGHEGMFSNVLLY